MNTLRFFTRLTNRQQEIVRLVAQGYTNLQIAEQLFIQPSVVAEHLTNVYTQLHDEMGVEQHPRPNRYTLVHMMTLLYTEYPEVGSSD